MKNLCIALGLLLASSMASATGYSSTGTVSLLDIVSDKYGSNESFFSITGFSSAGNCGTFNGLVVLRVQDPSSDGDSDRIIRAVQLAKVLGTAVTAFVTDTDRDSGGYCYLEQLEP